MRVGEGTPEVRSERMIQRIMDNLLWLHDQIDPVIRARSKLWYDGAEQIAEKWSIKYGILQVSGCGNACRPVSAERLVYECDDGRTRHGCSLRQDGSLIRCEDEGIVLSVPAEGGIKGCRRPNNIYGTTIWSRVRRCGKQSRRTTRKQLGLWIRAYDEAYHSSQYAIIHPEGDFGANKTTLEGRGVEPRMGWFRCSGQGSINLHRR
jgi:hypothetical protein